MDDLVKRLRNGTIQHVQRWCGDTHYDLGGSCNEDQTNKLLSEAADRIEMLERALTPFAKLYLYPDDAGLFVSDDIREDEDWDEEENDKKVEDLWVERGWIKEARAALEGKNG
jgi:hypothetical protein